MMFSKFSLIVLVAIMALASATDYESHDDDFKVSKARPAVRWASPIDFFGSHFPRLLCCNNRAKAARSAPAARAERVVAPPAARVAAPPAARVVRVAAPPAARVAALPQAARVAAPQAARMIRAIMMITAPAGTLMGFRECSYLALMVNVRPLYPSFVCFRLTRQKHRPSFSVLLQQLRKLRLSSGKSCR
jgi:hypothetical protein